LPKLDVAALMEQFRIEFLDGGRERLVILRGILDSLAAGGANAAQHAEFRRQLHTLKGQAGSFGYPSVTHIAHKLEDFLESAGKLSDENLGELERFVDEIGRIIESGIEPQPEETEALLRSLPSFQQHHAIQVNGMVVMPRGTWRELVGHELAARKSTLQFADNGLTAFSLALTMPPDLVVASMELSDMSGLELARIFAGVARTAHARFVILTSQEKDFSGMLPENVTIMHKTAQFAVALDKVLNEWWAA